MKKAIIIIIIIVAIIFLFPKPGDEYLISSRYSERWHRACSCVGIKVPVPGGRIDGIYKNLCMGIPFYYDKVYPMGKN